MPDVLDLDDGVFLHLPKTLTMANGEVVSGIQWHNQDELPANRAYPLFSFEGISFSPRGPGRKITPNRTEVLVQQVDTIAFVTGTLDYELSQWDAASITSVTGTVSGAPHTFVLTTDYILLDRKTIQWTAGGTKPDNTTNFVVTYQHRHYKRHYGADGTAVYRLRVMAKLYGTGDNKRGKSKMAKMCAQALADFVRLNSGKVLYKAPLSDDATHHLEAVGGEFLGSTKEYGDPSDSVIVWNVDFQVRTSQVLHGPAGPAVIEAPVDSDTV